MRTSTAALIVVLSLTLILLLTPLYAVYAIDSTKSGTPRYDTRAQMFLDQQKALQQIQKSKFEERFSQMKDKIASREAEFKLRLDKFRDKAKSDIAQRVNHNLNLINQNQTTQMNKHLDLMSSILDRVVASKDATASAQVTAARSAIDLARTTVGSQAGKDYTINVSTESAIRNDAQEMREKLFTDLKTTRETVITAKQAVQTAIRSLFRDKEGSKSATQSGLTISQ